MAATRSVRALLRRGRHQHRASTGPALLFSIGSMQVSWFVPNKKVASGTTVVAVFDQAGYEAAQGVRL